MESRQKRYQSWPRTKSKGREAEMESWTSREQTESGVARYGREKRLETTELIAVSPEVRTQSIDERDLSRSALNFAEMNIAEEHRGRHWERWESRQRGHVYFAMSTVSCQGHRHRDTPGLTKAGNFGGQKTSLRKNG